jgi:hypothetical protein
MGVDEGEVTGIPYVSAIGLIKPSQTSHLNKKRLLWHFFNQPIFIKYYNTLINNTFLLIQKINWRRQIKLFQWPNDTFLPVNAIIFHLVQSLALGKKGTLSVFHTLLKVLLQLKNGSFHQRNISKKEAFSLNLRPNCYLQPSVLQPYDSWHRVPTHLQQFLQP